MAKNRDYPYLGRKVLKEGQYVVMFVEENYGVVVMNEVEGNENIYFGKLGDFAEETFELLPPTECVRLQN